MKFKSDPLPTHIRFYIYGIQGFCDEIIFTSLFNFIFVKQDWSFKGHSSLSSFFIYGTCSLFVERLYIFLYYKHGIPWILRMPIHVLIAYTWEFSFGYILRLFDACPWDYSHYTYNYMGLITLEYAPGWMLLGYLQDMMADYLLRIQVLPEADTSHVKSTALTDQAVSFEKTIKEPANPMSKSDDNYEQQSAENGSRIRQRCN